MSTTLLLDLETWDLCADASGNIAMADEPYSLAQDVAMAIRTFLGDEYYNQQDGVPYLQQILGKTPPLQVFQQLIVEAALSASPEIVSAKCVINAYSAEDRTVQGQVLFIDSSHNTGAVSF